MDPQLLEVLRQIKLGTLNFRAKSHLPKDIERFQSTAKAVVHAEKVGYLEGVRPIRTSMRGALLYEAVLVPRGLTHEGELALTEALGESTPTDDLLGELFARLPDASIRENWEKAVHRCRSDPRGAVTAARSFLETTMKWILEQRGAPTTDNNKVLFSRTVRVLGLEVGRTPSGKLLEGVDAIVGV